MPPAGATAVADAALDALRDRGSPTHDGLSARMASFEAAPDRLELELEPVRWSLRLAAESAEGISALCVVRDSEGRWLAGRRAAWVASWAGRWALGAGGAVDLGESPAQTLARELHEEWSVTPQRLTAEALVRLPSGLVLMVGMAHLPPGARGGHGPRARRLRLVAGRDRRVAGGGRRAPAAHGEPAGLADRVAPGWRHPGICAAPQAQSRSRSCS